MRGAYMMQACFMMASCSSSGNLCWLDNIHHHVAFAGHKVAQLAVGCRQVEAAPLGARRPQSRLLAVTVAIADALGNHATRRRQDSNLCRGR